MIPSAMGERTELWSQQKSTDWGSSSATGSGPEMQHADQREQASRGIVVDLRLAFQPLGQDARTFVVNPAPGHVDRFDLAGRHVLHGVEVAFADGPVIL